MVTDKEQRAYLVCTFTPSSTPYLGVEKDLAGEASLFWRENRQCPSIAKLQTRTPLNHYCSDADTVERRRRDLANRKHEVLVVQQIKQY
jgi:hypothetical protein